MAMVELAAERSADKIYLHAFLDGRDTPPRSSKTLAKSKINLPLGKGRVASIHWPLLRHGSRQPLGSRCGGRLTI